jgi:hypothetical protein
MNDGTDKSVSSHKPILEEMADLLADHKLVPFFGAGISRQHLGVAAAELAHEMAKRLAASGNTPLSELADQFAERFGSVAFLGFLREKLVVSTLDDARVSAHRLLLSLSASVLYTPNQDNVFELTAAKYGRPYRRVVTLQDLSDAVPGERLLVKYHGDLDYPKTIVFGKRSYQRRMGAEDHPLDIRLRSDLLGKRLLFLGYSFRDENVNKLLDSVKRVFKGTLPPSYLIAFDDDPQMEDLAKTFGIQVISPLQLYPEAKDSAEAFERCLKSLCDHTLRLQSERGLEDLLSNRKINPRIATEYEVDAVSKAFEGVELDAAATAFRGALDQAFVAESLQRRVTDLFKQLVSRADPMNDAHMNTLKAVLFNIRLPPALAIEATASLMAACNRRLVEGFDPMISLGCPAIPDDGIPAAAAMAVAMLCAGGEAITDHFRSLAMFWFNGADEVRPEVQDMIKRMAQEVWPGGQNPLLRPSFLPRKGFHQIRTELEGQWPKQFRNPEG